MHPQMALDADLAPRAGRSVAGDRSAEPVPVEHGGEHGGGQGQDQPDQGGADQPGPATAIRPGVMGVLADAGRRATYAVGDPAPLGGGPTRGRTRARAIAGIGAGHANLHRTRTPLEWPRLRNRSGRRGVPGRALTARTSPAQPRGKVDARGPTCLFGRKSTGSWPPLFWCAFGPAGRSL